MPDLWTAPITADGATATPEQLQLAWNRWITCRERTASALMGQLDQAGVVGTAESWPLVRLADRMLQRARKAGVIRSERGRWHIVESADV